MTFNNLSKEWQICFDLSRQAFKKGSFPIGCLIKNTEDKIISTSYNKMIYGDKKTNMTQHAEMIALSKIPLTVLDKNKLILYVSVEPCPMCFGAINVARVTELHYGTRDPWAGSTNLIDGNWYMKWKKLNVIHEENEFEFMMAYWVCYSFIYKTKNLDLQNNEFINRWKVFFPNIIELLYRMKEIGIENLTKNNEKLFDALYQSCYQK